MIKCFVDIFYIPNLQLWAVMSTVVEELWIDFDHPVSFTVHLNSHRLLACLPHWNVTSKAGDQTYNFTLNDKWLNIKEAPKSPLCQRVARNQHSGFMSGLFIYNHFLTASFDKLERKKKVSYYAILTTALAEYR